jgi:hypothetical protein
MAAKLSIDTAETYESRAGTVSVAQALAWVESHASEDEDTGETNALSPGQLICYAVRRMQALAKDGRRFNAGKAPSRIYTPRVDVDGAARNAAEVKAGAEAAFAKLLHVQVAAPAPKARKVAKAPAAKPAKAPAAKVADKVKANEARMAEIERALAAKRAAKPTPAAKPPTVRKASKPAASHKRPDLSTDLRPVADHIQGAMPAPAAKPATVAEMILSLDLE